jgi:hypothetical protein
LVSERARCDFVHAQRNDEARAAASNFVFSINGGEKAASLLQAVDLVAVSAGHKNPSVRWALPRLRSAPMLTLDGITLRLGGHIVLDRASAALPPTSRVGLVGSQRRWQIEPVEADCRDL